MENLKKTVLILAGGRGTRFWPKSRKNYTKQFLSLTGDGKTMIQITVERLLPLVQLEDIYISTNEDYRDIVKQQLPNLPEENILCEPVGRNTAPCIGLGAVHISKKYDDAITEKITELQFNIFYLENDFEMMKQEPYLSYKKRLTKGKKLKILIKEKMPFVFKILKKEKLKIKHR